MKILHRGDNTTRLLDILHLLLHRIMKLNADLTIDRFCVAGISYRKADMSVRSHYSLDEERKVALLEEARSLGMVSVIVVSTCNRTEIYGYAAHSHVLGALLVKHTIGGNFEGLMQNGFFYHGIEAFDHLFKVASGLDSQIIGDFEIAGQLKQALALSKKFDMIGPIMDRTFNFVTQSSKKIKNATALSTGTVSVSFAAIEWLLSQFGQEPKSILVVGAGKFGMNVLKNLIAYLPNTSITLTNRTPEKALQIAQSLPVTVEPFDALPKIADRFDVIIACTNAAEPVVLQSYFATTKKRWFVDLSVPANIEAAAGRLPGAMLVNVDDISALLNDTINKRMSEVPKALEIIAHFKSEFFRWLQHYEHAPVIRDMKNKLLQLRNQQNGCEIAVDGLLPVNAASSNHEIITTVNTLMANLKTNKEKGCQMITAYHDYFTQQNALAPHG